GPCVLPCLAGRDERELGRGVEAFGLVSGEHLLRADGGLGGEGHRDLVRRDPVVSERVRAGDTGEQVRPVLRGGAAQSGGGADAGDDDARGHEVPCRGVGRRQSRRMPRPACAGVASAGVTPGRRR
ncbi:hypothetical protein ABE10_01910, partial [Bacillus toyonensis]|nr:hypothetical protein [Bacillus toyonensis]